MRRKPWWKQRNSLLLTIMVIVAVVLFVVDLFGGFVPLELLVYDRFWSRRAIHQWDERVVIVGFSTKDEDDYGEQPTDELLRQVLEKVNRGNPTTVGLNYTRHAKPQNPEEREGLEKQMAIMATRLVRSTLDDEYIIEPDNVMRREALYRNDDYYGVRIDPDFRMNRALAWAIAYHYLKAQGAKIEEPIKVYGATSITYPTGERVSFLPLSPSQDGGYHASTKDLNRYQVLLSFPQELPKTFFSFRDILNQPPVDFDGKIVIVGNLSKTNKNFLRTPIYQGEQTYIYLYNTMFVGLVVSNFLQLPQAPFVAVWSKGTEFLYLLGWLLFSTVLVWGLSFDLRKKYAWLIFLFGIIIAWLFVISGIFIVSFSVFPKLWIPCGWIWLGTSANIFIGAFAILELAVRDEQLLVLTEQKKVLTEQKKVSIEQKKALAEKTKRLEQEENYNQRLNQEIETLKNTLLAQERLAFIGKLTPFLRHRLLNYYDEFNLNNDVNKLQLDKLINAIDRLIIIAESVIGEENADEQKEYLVNLIEEFNNRYEAQTGVIDRSKELIQRFLPMLRNQEQQEYLQPEWIKVNELITESCRVARFDFKTFYRNLKVELNLDLSKELPNIYGFASELQFALVNVIENAYYAVWEKSQSQSQSQSQSNYTPTVTVRSDFSQERVKIIIEDNGVGIPPELVENIFKPFYSTKKRFQQTSGIGLTLTKDILEQHYNGQIYLDLDLQKGITCFVIELPYSDSN